MADELIRWPARDARSAPEATTGRPACGMPVLLFVDDDTRLLELYRDHFGPLGYRVKVAEHGAAAAQLVYYGTHVDLIVMDLCMPHVDGVLGMEVIREAAPHVPIIVVSGQVPLRDASLAGVSAILPKPVRMARLAAEIARALQREGAHA